MTRRALVILGVRCLVAAPLLWCLGAPAGPAQAQPDPLAEWCPSSDDLRQVAAWFSGGSGPSGFGFKRLCFGAASGGYGLSVV
jgi:hypothetical protein